ncbi:hypothetical protein M885DRAFT_528230 [Pelagophyceae sp. CCMP2097]|nr:hypothetical protein M885DRAFT_528230 [Pelagophyceae sp. CCMP2097]
MAPAFDVGGMDVSSAKSLVKDMLDAFDAETNRQRLRRAVLDARGDTSLLLTRVTPLAVTIASEALARRGVAADTGEAFQAAMRQLATLACQGPFAWGAGETPFAFSHACSRRAA